jgi:hypothetical protein
LKNKSTRVVGDEKYPMSKAHDTAEEPVLTGARFVCPQEVLAVDPVPGKSASACDRARKRLWPAAPSNHEHSLIQASGKVHAQK